MLPGRFLARQRTKREDLRYLSAKKALPTGLRRLGGLMLCKLIEAGQSLAFVFELHFAVVAV